MEPGQVVPADKTVQKHKNHFQEISNLKKNIFNKILMSSALIGAPILIISVIKLIDVGYWSFIPVYLLFYAFIVAVILLKKRISFRGQVNIILVIAILVSVALHLRFGLAGAGSWFFISLSILATALLGVRGGFALVACGAVSFIVSGVLIVNRLIPFDVNVVTNNLSALSWAIGCTLFIAIGFVVILPQGLLQANLLKSLNILQKRSDELEESNKLLQNEIDSRILAEQKADELREQLIQSQKMEAVGRLAGGVAHDFNNLLTGILGNISIAQMDLAEDDPMIEVFDELEDAGEKAANLIKQLLTFSRKQISKPVVIDLNQTVSQMKTMLDRIISENIDLTVDLIKAETIIMADPTQIEQVVVNLAVNGRDAMPNGGNLHLKTELIEFDTEEVMTHGNLEAGKYAVLICSDRGVGMNEETMQKICEPFYTTKDVGKGTGLGLSTVYGIVGQHKGAIDITSKLSEGSTFKIFLPVCETCKPEPRRLKKSVTLPSGGETILMVEDERLVRQMNRKIIERLGYNVLIAENGPSAIKLASQHKDTISLLLTDVIMPGMNGKDMAEEIIKIHPETKVLFNSGYARDVIGHHGVLDKDVNFISKPYSIDKLAGKIRNVLEKP